MEMVRIAKVELDKVQHVGINPFLKPHIFDARIKRGDCIIFCVCSQRKLLRRLREQTWVNFPLPKRLLCLNLEWGEDPNLGWYHFDSCQMTHESVYEHFYNYAVHFFVIFGRL